MSDYAMIFLIIIGLLLAFGMGFFFGRAMGSEVANVGDVMEAGGRIEARLDLIEDMVQAQVTVPVEQARPDRNDPLGQMNREQWVRFLHDEYKGLTQGQKRR
jgi:hypothetical protein